MKILRPIGAFFAKIGRWIANTAWVQPLLIVGGIFGIIFSIPYIKKGFEGLFSGDDDEDYEWYEARALGLEENGQADRLLTYLEEFDNTNAEKIRSEFGSKFFLTFAKKGCTNCNDAIEGYKYAANAGWAEGLKIYTFLVDKMDDDGEEYIAKPIYDNHNDLFAQLKETFEEDSDDYPLYRNLINKGKSSTVTTLKERVAKLYGAAKSDEGLDTPLTLLIDLDTEYYGSNGVTALFFNYIDFDESTTINAATKAQVVRDIWNYEGYFDKDYE